MKILLFLFLTVPVFAQYPNITSISPNNGQLQGGETVTIAGTGLGLSPRVFFGTYACSVVGVSTVAVTVVSPAVSVGGVYSAYVQAGIYTSNSLNFFYIQNTPTSTATNTVTNTATCTATNTATCTATNTATQTSTSTTANTATSTATSTATATATKTATCTSTNTTTTTPTVTQTLTPSPSPTPQMIAPYYVANSQSITATTGYAAMVVGAWPFSTAMAAASITGGSGAATMVLYSNINPTYSSYVSIGAFTVSGSSGNGSLAVTTMPGLSYAVSVLGMSASTTMTTWVSGVH